MYIYKINLNQVKNGSVNIIICIQGKNLKYFENNKKNYII